MKDIKIDLYTFAYNEEFLAPLVMKYWDLLPIRKIIVFNNRSTDNTVNILKQNNKVEIRDFDTNNTIDDVKLINYKNNAWKESIGKVDYVCVCDLDEILYSDNILLYLNKLKENNIDILDTPGFGCICDKLHIDNNKLIHQYDDMRFVTYKKNILFNPNTIKEINYCYGAHRCAATKNNNETIKIGKCDKIFMLHLSPLTLDFILNRHRLYASRLSNFNKQYKLGWHYTKTDEEKINDFNKEFNASLSYKETF